MVPSAEDFVDQDHLWWKSTAKWTKFIRTQREGYEFMSAQKQVGP